MSKITFRKTIGPGTIDLELRLAAVALEADQMIIPLAVKRSVLDDPKETYTLADGTEVQRQIIQGANDNSVYIHFSNVANGQISPELRTNLFKRAYIQINPKTY